MKMFCEKPMDVIKCYLNDAIALEKNSEVQLRRFAKEATRSDIRDLFAAHADETRTRCERVTSRLAALGGSASMVKDVVARLFTFKTSPAEWGHTDCEKDLRDLVGAFTVQQSEIAVYEALAAVSAAAGDTETERLAREIQNEAQQAADMIWNILGTSARLAFFKITSYPEREVA